MKGDIIYHVLIFGSLLVIAIPLSIYFGDLSSNEIHPLIIYIFLSPIILEFQWRHYNQKLKNRDISEENYKLSKIGEIVAVNERKPNYGLLFFILLIYYTVFGGVIEGAFQKDNDFSWALIPFFLILTVFVLYRVYLETGKAEFTVQISDPLDYVQNSIIILRGMKYEVEIADNDLYILKNKKKNKEVSIRKQGVFIKQIIEFDDFNKMRKKILKLQNSMDLTKIDDKSQSNSDKKGIMKDLEFRQIDVSDKTKELKSKKLGYKTSKNSTPENTIGYVGSNSNTKISAIRVRKLKSDIYGELSMTDRSIIVSKFARNNGYIFEEVVKLLTDGVMVDFGSFDKIDSDIYIISFQPFLLHKWGRPILIAAGTSFLTLLFRSIFFS